MLGDKLPEEIEYEEDKKREAELIKLVDLASCVVKELKEISRSFYVIGINPKKKIFTCKKVNCLNDGYRLVKEKGLTIYCFADNVFQKWNIGE